jgi:hypothetical protein
MKTGIRDIVSGILTGEFTGLRKFHSPASTSSPICGSMEMAQL